MRRFTTEPLTDADLRECYRWASGRDGSIVRTADRDLKIF